VSLATATIHTGEQKLIDSLLEIYRGLGEEIEPYEDALDLAEAPAALPEAAQ
jgi:hypothetical protein